MIQDLSKHAVASLEGLTLGSGWKVVKHIPRAEHATGGTFSNSYLVEKDGVKAFLKAFDFTTAFESNNLLVSLQQMITAYLYERDLLLHCNQKKLRRVVTAIDHGEVQVPGYHQMNGRVFYLIFELADGDMRSQVMESERLDTLRSLRAFKDIASALQQVHGQMIAHQDAKPSNILLFGKNYRLADFGRASRKGFPAVHDIHHVAGDHTYAPPEQLYGYDHPDFNARRFGCDLYMLGNLATFMFTGINVTANLFNRLDPQFHPRNWADNYANVLPYVMAAYTVVMGDIRKVMHPAIRVDVVPIIEQLCNPDLGKRGHPKGLGRFDQFSLERYVSILDRLSKLLEFKLRNKEKVG